MRQGEGRARDTVGEEGEEGRKDSRKGWGAREREREREQNEGQRERERRQQLQREQQQLQRQQQRQQQEQQQEHQPEANSTLQTLPIMLSSATDMTLSSLFM